MKILLTVEQYTTICEIALCKRGMETAQAKFTRYPSAYANGYAVQVCKGMKPDLQGVTKATPPYKSEDCECEQTIDKTPPNLNYFPLEEALYKGRKITLNKPFRTPNSRKKFAVYVRNKNGDIMIVRFGDPNLKIKNYDPKAAASFQKRHKCNQKNDKTKAGYWSCNVGRYAKLLGLSSSRKW